MLGEEVGRRKGENVIALSSAGGVLGFWRSVACVAIRAAFRWRRARVNG